MRATVLHNIRILDFSWVLAGPYATRLLADFGAEVIKVQPLIPPDDDSPFARGYYAAWNRNKRGITLNMSQPEGLALARKLAGISDAVVENFTPRVMDNWGLDYASLKRIKPDIIMLSMSAMGHSGPRRDFAGYGPSVHAFSGLTSLTVDVEMPLGPGFSYADHIAGLYATLAMLGALEYRHRTGKGQYIDISQVESMISLLGSQILDSTMHGSEAVPVGNRSNCTAPHGVYRCRGNDRWCAIAVFNDDEWLRCKKAMGNPAWAGTEKYATMAGRLSHREELDRLMERWTRQHDASDIMKKLQGEGVSAGVVQDAADLAADPQLNSRGFFLNTEPAKRGSSIHDVSPIRLSATPARYDRAAPAPGRDNDYVFGELLDIGEDEMNELKLAGII